MAMRLPLASATAVAFDKADGVRQQDTELDRLQSFLQSDSLSVLSGQPLIFEKSDGYLSFLYYYNCCVCWASCCIPMCFTPGAVCCAGKIAHDASFELNQHRIEAVLPQVSIYMTLTCA
jgi:hypothetical protein